MEISKVLVLDVDGVLTDNKVVYTSQGVSMKKFHIDDGYWLKKISQIIPVLILSGHRCEAVRFRFKGIIDDSRIAVGVNSKADWIRETSFIQKTDDIIVVGNSYSDLEIMRKSWYSFCPKDSIDEIKKIADHQLTRLGGEGVLEEVYACLLKLKTQFI